MTMSDKPLVTIDAVAEHFAVSVSTVRKWIREDRIPKNTYLKIGTTYRFKLDRLDAAMIGDVDRNPQLEIDFDEGTGDDEDTDSNRIALY